MTPGETTRARPAAARRYRVRVFLVRTPVSLLFGFAARKGAERVTHSALARAKGIEGDERPEPTDLSVELKWALAAAIVEAVVFAVAKTLAARSTERVAGVLAGKSAPRKG